MKKLTIILLLSLFAVGFTSCADSSETDPVIPEVQIDSVEGEEEAEEEGEGNT